MKQKSFSLIEVLIAITVFTFGILSAFILIPLGTKLSTTTENETMAIGLAQSILDNTISQNYDSIIVGDSGIINYTQDQSSPYSIFKYQKVIENIDSNYETTATNSGIKSIKVIMSWNQNGQNKTYELFTTLAKK